MEITAALAADLAMLSEALDGTGADITGALSQLVADVRLAVRSYAGLTVLAGGDPALAGAPVVLTTMVTGAGEVVSSLLVPLTDGIAQGQSLAVVLYATRPGAFVDLAADLAWLTGRAHEEFVLDRHLRPPRRRDAPSALRAASLVNQAIGVLMGQGYLLEDARAELGRRARAAGHSAAAAAQLILDAIARTTDDT